MTYTDKASYAKTRTSTVKGPTPMHGQFMICMCVSSWDRADGTNAEYNTQLRSPRYMLQCIHTFVQCEISRYMYMFMYVSRYMYMYMLCICICICICICYICKYHVICICIWNIVLYVYVYVRITLYVYVYVALYVICICIHTYVM